jgi:hypothetical protein
MPPKAGICYLCGKEYDKAKMKAHFLSEHRTQELGQDCFVIKAEGVDDKSYWLFFDVPMDSSLSTVDSFLRKIWLDCCGHLSEFDGTSKSRKIGDFETGDTLIHSYDFGSTTETKLTFVGKTKRSPQRTKVRLLARNKMPEFKCACCGKPAEFVCTEASPSADSTFCEECADGLEQSEMFLPITNSPRSGICGYTGEHDDFSVDS